MARKRKIESWPPACYKKDRGLKMTKNERAKIKHAIDCFLSNDEDEWTDGINELYLLVYGIKWTSMLPACKRALLKDIVAEHKTAVMGD
jgi:hypothetical protein